MSFSRTSSSPSRFPLAMLAASSDARCPAVNLLPAVGRSRTRARFRSPPSELRAPSPSPSPEPRASRLDLSSTRRMGLWDRIRGVGKGGYRARAAEKLESEGELENAALAYVEAALPDEAARVILLRADVEPSLERRVALFDRAAGLAADPELARKARARKARLSYDLVRAHGTLARSELFGAATELEAAGEHDLAAEAFKLLGDTEGEVRALTAAGASKKHEEGVRTAPLVSKRG